jgi:hypothetical protein
MAGMAARKNVAAGGFGADGAKPQAGGVGKNLTAKVPNEPIQHYKVVPTASNDLSLWLWQGARRKGNLF